MPLQWTVKVCSTYRTKVEAGKKKVFERAGSWVTETFHNASYGAVGANFAGDDAAKIVDLGFSAVLSEALERFTFVPSRESSMTGKLDR
jgi:hypothetical protein